MVVQWIGKRRDWRLICGSAPRRYGSLARRKQYPKRPIETLLAELQRKKLPEKRPVSLVPLYFHNSKGGNVSSLKFRVKESYFGCWSLFKGRFLEPRSIAVGYSRCELLRRDNYHQIHFYFIQVVITKYENRWNFVTIDYGGHSGSAGSSPISPKSSLKELFNTLITSIIAGKVNATCSVNTLTLHEHRAGMLFPITTHYTSTKLKYTVRAKFR